MNRFNAEFSRLYLVPDEASPAHGQLVGAGGTVKAMVLELARPADWAELSTLWLSVQNELELPAAAIAVSGTDGLQLWFSVSAPVSATDAADFLAALQNKYLGATPAKRVELYPSRALVATGHAVHARQVPAAIDGTGNWSAFVSPDLASVFGEEPWLDMPPNQDQQADILSRLKSMAVSQFREVLSRLGTTPAHLSPPVDALVGQPLGNGKVASGQGAAKMGPQEFLMQVMNDPSLGLADRIEAAKALLPYVR